MLYEGINFCVTVIESISQATPRKGLEAPRPVLCE